MKSSIDLFIHQDGKGPKVLTVSESDTVQAILERAGVTKPGDYRLTIVDDAAVLDDESADHHPNHDDTLLPQTIEAKKVKHGSHLFCHHCRKVSVTVFYKHCSSEVELPPRVRIRRLLKWALKEFKLSDEDVKNLYLSVSGQKLGARPTQHLGEFVKPPICEVSFDLLPNPKING